MKIIVIILSRGVGGLEKRAAAVYSFLASYTSTNCEIEFLINRTQYSLISKYKCEISNKNLTINCFGIPYFKSIYNQNALFYIIDYIFLFFKLLFNILKLKSYNIAYITKLPCLNFFHLIRSNKIIFATVDSNNTKKYTNSKIFRYCLSKGLIIDSLSESIKNTIDGNLPKNKYSSQIFSTPCSFIDYNETKIDKKEKSICFASRLVDGKGVNLLLESLPIILKNHPDTKIWILGDGPLYNTVKNFLINRHQISYHIGFEKFPISFFKKSLIFLSLQDKENYPSQSLLEAMACGNCVVATDVGDTHKLVDSSNGVLVHRDGTDIALAVCNLLENPLKTQSLGRNGRNKVLNEHNIPRYLKYFKKTFFYKSSRK